MRKIEQEENARKFDHCLRCYSDVLRWGVRPNYPDEVSRYEYARRERAFKLAYEHCCLHAHDGDLDSVAMIDLVDDYEDFYLSFAKLK